MIKYLQIIIFIFGISRISFAGNNETYTILLGSPASEALKISAGDVSKYLKQAVTGAAVQIESYKAGKKYKGNIIAIGNRYNNGFIGKIAQSGKLNPPPTAWNSFEITSQIAKTGNIYILEGADQMGQQYACYEFVERALGVRFLGPEIEHVPSLKNLKEIVNMGIQKPHIKWRGLQIWNYHYDERGTGSFCDINDRFKAKDWQWYKRMCDWLVKNKQNYVQWYDETMCFEPISQKLDSQVISYFAMRGIKKLVGLGWAANEGKPKEWVLGKHDFDTSKVCIGEDGKAIGHENVFTVAPCPAVPAYFPLAGKNINAFDFSKDDILGAVLGYGETERSQSNHNGCVRHSNISAHDLILKDLDFVNKQIGAQTARRVNLGFVIMDFGGAEAPLRTKKMFDLLPDSAILFLWTYRDFAWESNRQIYQWADEAKKNGKTIQIFQQAEVDFICQSDLPIYRFDIWKRREAHFRSTQKLDITGHTTNYNTNQYMMWMSYWQMMRWQWNVGDQSWDQHLFALADDIGGQDSEKLKELFKRVISLEYVRAFNDFDFIKGTSEKLREIEHWRRWANSKDYNNDHGFMLWANVNDLAQLDDATQNIIAARSIMEDLKKNASNKIFNQHIYPVLQYTLNYYALRIHLGKSAAHISVYQQNKIAEHLNSAIQEIELAIIEKKWYDSNLKAVSNTCGDFIINPDEQLLVRYKNLFQKFGSAPGDNLLTNYKPFDWKKHKDFL